MRRLFGCPDIVSLTEKFLMARNFYGIFTENNPVMGDSKTFGIPEAKGLRKENLYSDKKTKHEQYIFLCNHKLYNITFDTILPWISFKSNVHHHLINLPPAQNKRT